MKQGETVSLASGERALHTVILSATTIDLALTTLAGVPDADILHETGRMAAERGHVVGTLHALFLRLLERAIV